MNILFFFKNGLNLGRRKKRIMNYFIKNINLKKMNKKKILN